MSAAFCRSISAALARSSRSLLSASSALAVQSAWIWSSRPIARADLLDVRDLPRRRSPDLNQLSSISRMIMRIIFAGSSTRSRSSVMFAAKMSRARLNTGPLNQVAMGASRTLGRSPPPSPAAACGPAHALRGFRVQALTGPGGWWHWPAAGPTAAPTATVLVTSARGDRDQRAGEATSTTFEISLLVGPSIALQADANPYSRAVPIPENWEKLPMIWFG